LGNQNGYSYSPPAVQQQNNQFQGYSYNQPTPRPNQQPQPPQQPKQPSFTYTTSQTQPQNVPQQVGYSYNPPQPATQQNNAKPPSSSPPQPSYGIPQQPQTSPPSNNYNPPKPQAQPRPQGSYIYTGVPATSTPRPQPSQSGYSYSPTQIQITQVQFKPQQTSGAGGYNYNPPSIPFATPTSQANPQSQFPYSGPTQSPLPTFTTSSPTQTYSASAISPSIASSNGRNLNFQSSPQPNGSPSQPSGGYLTPKPGQSSTQTQSAGYGSQTQQPTQIRFDEFAAPQSESQPQPVYG